MTMNSPDSHTAVIHAAALGLKNLRKKEYVIETTFSAYHSIHE